MTHLSDSLVQGEIEKIIVRWLGIKHNCKFSKKRGTSKFEFDFFNEEKKIIGEIYAGIDTLKPAQKNKVITDCFKLVAAERKFGGEWKKYIVFVDEKIKKQFTGDNWRSEAIDSSGIKLCEFKLPEKYKKKLSEAKERQREGSKLNRVV